MRFDFLSKGLAGLIISASCLVSVAHAGLIHSYNYDGNALDSTGSAHGTTNQVTLTTDRFGNANSAYYFNGTNSSIISTFTNPQTATYSLWATLTPDTYWGDMLFSAGTTTGTDLWTACGKLMWNTWDSCGNPFGSNTIPVNLNDGDFHHYVVVNDQGLNKTSLYIDGALFGEAAYKFKAGNVFAVGNHCAGCTDYNWNGKIDDVKVFDTALSQSEVNNLYTPVPEPSTIAIFALGIIGLSARRFKKNS